MKAQEIFETVVWHLYKQGHPAMKNSQCMYRAPNGDKCAVGCLIPDDIYDPAMEGGNLEQLYHPNKSTYVETPRRAFGHVLPPWFKTHFTLLTKLQEAHDTCGQRGDIAFDEEELSDNLLQIAERFGLDASFMNDLHMAGEKVA